ncbi:hypothetical protein ALP72_200016 [Pseudomonas coronafaciens pv. coronafaciens]|nr:hypothetical protein ALP72_200016 [Pseudomonas coronafaciens pv. coronafaciens]
MARHPLNRLFSVHPLAWMSHHAVLHALEQASTHQLFTFLDLGWNTGGGAKDCRFSCHRVCGKIADSGFEACILQNIIGE